MLSIPSPDVVVNLFASLGQLLALLSLVAGGAAVKMRRKGAHGRIAPTSRRLLYTTVGLMVTSWVSFGMYFAYVQDLSTSRLRANLVRSSTEQGKAVGDSSLKTLSFSGQMTHPQGMSTESLRQAMAVTGSLNLIDVRETEETESGRLPGSRHVRYPDLQQHRRGLVVDGKTTVLVCYSGNRSSELAETFARQGIACKFLVGGYEKWIAEHGVLTGNSDRRELRELPVSPNSDVLIDTPDAVAAVVENRALFVDVRYPEDFAKGHLPGAINLPLRMLRSDEVEQRLAALPKQPIMVPCYDKRSSFYGLILGLRLHRGGHEFLGRYTVPHEYPVAGKTRAHVAVWQQDQAGSTPFSLIKSGLAAALALLQQFGGSLAIAILLLVVLIRGLLSPLTFKADLDQYRRLEMEPRVAALRDEHASDPVRAQRAVMDLYKRAGFTPLRNLLVSMGQLMLFLAFFAVIREAAVGSTESLFGIWTLGVADATGTLPVLVGALMATIVCNGKMTRRKAVMAALLGVFLAAITWQIAAAGNLYLVSSLVWVVVQGRLARRMASNVGRTSKVDLSKQGVVTLREAAQVESTGNKAIRLGQMLEAGLPVPDGFALTDLALELAHGEGRIGEADHREIVRLHRRLGAEHVAVRSSGLKEDGGEKSYAGVFESVLEVKTDGLFDAIEFVRTSMDSDRARAYGDGDERGGIVVQAMVPAEHAGVMFTEHPGSSGSMLIELVEGLCEQLVGGTVTPKEFEFTRMSNERLTKQDPPIDLAPLLQLGRQVEDLFGAPQDIEWAYANGQFFLLQARDVTVSAGTGQTPEALRQRERARLLAIAGRVESAQVVFAQNELSELLPDPKPFSLAFMNSLWAPGGSVDLACRSMGVPYDAADNCSDYVVEVFGKLYVNRREEQRRLAKGMGGLASFRITRGAEALESEFRESFLVEFHRRMRVLEATDPARLSDEDLFGLWQEVRDEFVTSTYVEAERINIATDFFVKTASEQLQRRGLNPAAALSGIPETVVHRAFAILPAIAQGEALVKEFVELFGHRARHDFEFSEPRYVDQPQQVADLARACRAPAVHAACASSDIEIEASRILRISLDRARRFQALKEEAKHQATRELAVLRCLTLEIGRRVGLGEKVFWLTPEEVAALSFGIDHATHELIETRMLARETFESLDLPVALTLGDLETMRLDDGPVILRSDVSGEMRGKRVAGDSEVIGRVRVVHDASEIEDFIDGEILVARFTDPTWSTVFPIAGGLITEVGGWLSHAAIQAREYGLACIVDVPGAGRKLRTGDVVRLGLDGSIEKVAQAANADQGGKIFEFGIKRAGGSNGVKAAAVG